jgi:hypothetical protein
VNFFIGVTDYEWFRLHAAKQNVEEVLSRGFGCPPKPADFDNHLPATDSGRAAPTLSPAIRHYNHATSTEKVRDLSWG